MSLKTASSFDEQKGMSVFGFQTDFEQVDVGVGLGIPLCVLLLGLINTAPIYITLPATAFTAIITLSLVFMSPSHLNVKEYIDTIRYYFKHRADVDNTNTETIASDQDVPLQNFVVEETTRDMTGVDAFYPESNLVKREDGHVAGGVRIDPPNRDFDSGEELVELSEKIKEAINKDIDFSFQLYVTTQPFPIDEYIAEIESRLDDKDIEDRPIMEAVLKEKVENRPEALEERGTELPYYYLIATAAPDEIAVSSSGTQSPVERLTRLPVIGFLAELFVNIQDDSEEFEREARMIERAHERIARLNAAVVNTSTEEFSSTPVSVIEWAELFERLWEGNEGQGPTVRDSPIVRGQADLPGVVNDIAAKQSEGEPGVEAISLDGPDSVNAQGGISGD